MTLIQKLKIFWHYYQCGVGFRAAYIWTQIEAKQQKLAKIIAELSTEERKDIENLHKNINKFWDDVE